MSYTTDNYEFTVPEIDDIPDISVLSQNWDNLDEILNGIDTRNKIETASSTVDLNGYTEQGIYRFTSSHTPTNVPSGCTEGWLFVVPWNNAYEAVQFWLNYADRKVYIRKRVYPTWGEWNGLTTSAELSDIYNQLHGAIESNTALIVALQAAIGSPLVASSAESMTDQTKVYVYTGTTTSTLTNGHWYYYDNGWTDGGVYNSFALETDKTLSIPDMAADAETVGDELTDLKSAINNYFTDDVNRDYEYLSPDKWDIGNITIENDGWTYADSDKRVRTKQGVTYTLSVGDIISMSSWTGHRMYIGWYNGSEYKKQGWLTSDYVVTESGNYVILLGNTTETTLPNMWELLDLLVIKRISGYEKQLYDIEQVANICTTEITLTPNQVIENSLVYGNSGVFSESNNNYVRTDYISIHNAYVGSKIALLTSLIGNGGIAFYDSNKSFISGVHGNNASSLGYISGTQYQAYVVPENASYFAATLEKAYYSSINVFKIKYISANWFSEMNQIQLTSDYLQLGTIDSTGHAIPTESARCYSNFICANTGDKISNSTNYISVFEYDRNTFELLTSTTGTWVHNYTVINDCYLRILFLSNDMSTAASNTSIQCKSRYIKRLRINELYNVEQLKKIVSKEPLDNNAFYGGALASGNYAFMSIAHRGYNMSAPENTLPAFKMAREKGFSWVETDIQFTSDGVPVLIHDWTVDRTSDGTGKITDMTYAEASALDFGSWKSPDFAGTKILKLDEFLSFCRAVGLNAVLEFKANVPYTNLQLNTIFSLVHKYHMEDNVIWIPTGYISEVSAKYPNGKICIGVSGVITQQSVDQAISISTSNNTVYILTPITQNTDESVALASSEDVPVIFWNIKSESDIENANPWISGFITDGVNPNNVLYKSHMI